MSQIGIKIKGLFIITIIITSSFTPFISEAIADFRTPVNQSTYRELRQLVKDLSEVTTNKTDSDGDGLFDVVERIIGTDPFEEDSDYDNLSDYNEVWNATDPINPDSNWDGIPDSLEMVSLLVEDLDGDGEPNVWDTDNDGDGVNDAVDMSPFAYSEVNESFHMELELEGNPTTISFHIVPENPDHLKLYNQIWDWPDGDEGLMRDLDSSKEDVIIRPVLNITGNYLPNQTDVLEYGIVRKNGSVIVPLFPVTDNGDIVAYNAKMFYTNSTPSSLSLDVKLVWQIIGTTDTDKMFSLKAENGKYLSVSENGVVKANGLEVGASEKFLWIEAGYSSINLQPLIGLRSCLTGLFLSIDETGLLVAKDEVMGSNGKFFYSEWEQGMVFQSNQTLKILTLEDDDSIKAIWGSDMIYFVKPYFHRSDQGYMQQRVELVHYQENFMITGLNVEENHRSQAGVFFTDDLNVSIAANLDLQYEYLYNANTTLSEIPQVLEARGVNIQAILDDSAYKDEAYKHILNPIIPDALSSLPDNRVLPIILAFENTLSSIDMAELSTESHVLGNIFHIDLAGESHSTVKSLKTEWFHTTDFSCLDILEIIEFIDGLGLSENITSNLITLQLNWCTGEDVISKIGDQSTQFNSPEIEQVLEVINDIISYQTLNFFKYSVKAVVTGWFAYRKFKLYEGLVAKGWSISLGKGTNWSKLSKLARVKHCFRQINIAKAAKAAKLMGHIARARILKLANACKYVPNIGSMVAIGIGIYSLWAVSDCADWGPCGKSRLEMKATVDLTVSIIVGLISIFHPPILILEVLYLGFSESGLFDILISIYNYCTGETHPSFEIVGNPEISNFDFDYNGLDVGDRIEYSSTIESKVHSGKGKLQKATPWDLVKNSYYYVWFEMSAPPGSNAETGFLWSEANITTEAYANWARKAWEYESSAWIEPDIPMLNFPVTLLLGYNYKLYYEERWWFIFYFYQTRSYRGSQTETADVLYFDVMPGSLEDFLDWKALTPLDHDCDGLLNTEEPGREWSYDYDGDGLRDGYEKEIGSDPLQQDTDRDGLMDYYEILYKTNVTDADSDDDGLVDYTEVAGWLIDFSYAGKNFTIHVSSDPKLNDTDGDGVNDEWEYYSDLNPRSQDTNGDGIADVGIDYSKIKVEFVTKWEYPACVEFPHSDIAIDQNNGFIYVTSMFWSPYISPAHDPGIMKYHLNGTFISFIPVVTSYYLLGGAIAVDSNGDLYYGFPYNPDSTRPEFCIQKFDPSGNLLTNITFLEYDLITAVAVDGEGYIYIGGWNTQVKKYSSTGQLISSESDFVVPGEFLGVPDIAIDDKTGYVYVVNAWIDGLSQKANVVIFNSSGKYIDSLPFWYPIGVAVDQDSNVYMIDRSYTKIHKFDPKWNLITSWGEYGSNDGQFIDPFSICVDLEGNIYVTSDNFLHPGYIHKFSQENIPVRPIHEDTTSDRDGDGLNNTLEENGWGITFTNTTGTFSLHVTSDPYLNDTDFDGFTDYQEYQWLTNPRDPDTDDDGLCDYNEWKGYPQQTNALHHDTDQDGLSDGTEITYGSNPSEPDTDGDGLTDLEEFNLRSSSKSPDTDKDGVNDKDEKTMSSDLISPDSDGDMMFDGLEYTLGTDMLNNDTDGDGLLDGQEFFYNTDPKDNDTDGDNLPDGFEVMKKLNPCNNDTDGDGLIDSIEIQNGTNPLNPDTDMDGIPDSEDEDSQSTWQMNITIAYDTNYPIEEYLENLEQYSNLTKVGKDELLGERSNDPLIVLVGGQGGEISNLVDDILQDTPDVLENLKNGTLRTVTRYGLWTSTQTVFITWNPSPMDYLYTLDTLRRKTVTIEPGSITANYTMSLKMQIPETEENNQTALSIYFLELYEIDAVKQTDSALYAVLEDSVEPWLTLRKYNESNTPTKLTASTGLLPHEYSLGKYLDITHCDCLQNSTGDVVETAFIQIYYRESELDRTGDGIANDPTDLDENTLSLYYLDDQNNWVKLTEDLDWIYDIGVNTTDIYLYGENYDGYIWALTGHLSLYGAAASTFNQPPDVTNAYPSRSTLWPPNGKYVNVTVEGVTDPDGDNVTITITGVTSDEPSASAKGSGGKEHAPDAAGVGTDTASLRAERSGKGNGRVYVIHFLACDGWGGETTGSVFVCIPHDVRKGDIVCVDDGQLYDATAKN